MLDRVAERRRAAQLARHYRDQEGLSIAEIARRLGRAEATVKAYLYDPTGDKARAVKARYRGVCRGCGAPTAPRNGKGDAYAYCKRCHPGAIAPQWTRERVREAMRAWRARYGAAPSSYDWSRTHARRRGGEALKRLQAGEWPAPSTSPICTGAGRRPAPTPSAAPERPGLNAVVTRTLACAWSSVNGGAEDRRNATAIRLFAAATRASAPGDCWARGATARCACRPPRIGPPASTSTTLATAAKEGSRAGRCHQPLGPSATPRDPRLATDESQGPATNF